MPRRDHHRKRRPFRLEQLESRRLMAGLAGSTDLDLGEFLVGRVAVTPIFLESNGQRDESTEDWTPEEIAENLEKITEGVNWWSNLLDTLDTVHTLDFVIDDTYAVDPVETPWEPIANISDEFSRYLSRFLIDEGYGGNSLNRAMQLFNNDQREKHDADWAFTIIVVDASNDEDGFFETGGLGFLGAFAFNYGSFIVTPNSRPASTIAHELGHIFQAFDEYPGPADYTRRGGYYNTQNLNAADNPTPGFVQEDSILRSGIALQEAYDALVSPASTLATVGWQDSDGDGVFDFADVPLSLDAVGYLDPESSVYRFSGSAAAVPLLNQNSSVLNLRSDITPNVISEIQYRVDGGDWQIAVESGLPDLEFSLEVPVPSSFDSIEFRAIDTTTGITSPIVQGNENTHSFDDNGVRGFAFLDTNGDGQRDSDDELLPNTQVSIRRADGTETLQGVVRASEHSGVLGDLDGVTLTAEGSQISSNVLSLFSNDALAQPVFFWENTISDPIEQTERWDENAVLLAEFDDAVGEVGISAVGLDRGSHVRIAGYDANNQLIGRVTSDLIAAGEEGELVLSDPEGRIKSVRIFGQGIVSRAEFSYGAAISEIRFGTSTETTTGPDGAFRFPNLAAGEYVLDFAQDSVIREFQNESITVQVSAASDAIVSAPVISVDSPRYNSTLPFDVDQNGIIAPLDVILIINDLADNGFRALSVGESDGFQIDVDNDGRAAALDALLVINYLVDQAASGEGVESQQSDVDRPVEDSDDVNDSQLVQATDLALTQWTNDSYPQDYEPFGADSQSDPVLNYAGRANVAESPDPRTTDTRYVGLNSASLDGENNDKHLDSQAEPINLAAFSHQIQLDPTGFRLDFAELAGRDLV